MGQIKNIKLHIVTDIKRLEMDFGLPTGNSGIVPNFTWRQQQQQQQQQQQTQSGQQLQQPGQSGNAPLCINDISNTGDDGNDDNTHLLQAVQQLTFVTKQKVDEEISICMQELRSRISFIVDEQQKDTEYILGFDTRQVQYPLVMDQDQSPMDSGVEYCEGSPYPQQQQSQQPLLMYGEQAADPVAETQSSDYYTCELDNGSDLSMHSAHYSEEMVENRKNLYVMRILTSIMNIHNVLNKHSESASSTSTS